MTTKTWSVHHFDEVESTQNIAFELARDIPEQRHVVVARQQTGGRGRAGNTWVSPVGNLYGSIVLHPNVPAIDAGTFSFVAAVAVSSALAEFIDAPHIIQHKWPNDIQVDGRKIAGILLESDVGIDGVIKTLVVGLGINLCTAPDGAIALNSVTASSPPTVDECLDRLLSHLDTKLSLLKTDGFSAIRQEWLDRARGLGERLRVRLPEDVFEGVFVGLSPDGALCVQLENENRTRIIRSGEVFFA